MMQLINSDSCSFIGLQSSPSSWLDKSARNMLNKRGLRMIGCSRLNDSDWLFVFYTQVFTARRFGALFSDEAVEYIS